MSQPSAPGGAAAGPSRPARRRRPLPAWWGGLALLSPSIIVLAVFVYGLIGWTARLSLTDKRGLGDEGEFVGLDTYAELIADDRFGHSVRNLLILTAVFLVGTMLTGLLWALLLERPIPGEGFFRAVYLFPMAVSFIASGVVWRWLLNSAEGEHAGGLNRLFGEIGLGFLQNRWWSDPEWGIAAIAIPAIWQLSGYVMALFLAGFRGIPAELREAAAMDGASTYQLYRHVLFPQVTPVALAALIIIGHMSLKMFDLIMAISGAQYLTEVPAVYLWTLLLQNDYARASAVAILLLAVVAVLIVPYLVSSARAERRS